jgi:hypothetical protein
MGWVDELRGKTVALDTAPLIFFIERSPQYIDILRPFFQAVDRGDTRVVTSTVTLLEVLVHPLRRGDDSLAHQYNDILLCSPHIFTVPVTPATSQAAAEIRAATNLKTPMPFTWQLPSITTPTCSSPTTGTLAIQRGSRFFAYET